MSELNEFVKSALTAGRSRDEIREVLASAGWPQDEVTDALSRYADVAFPIPVPKRRYSTSAQEAFLYLVTFAALYTAAISLGALLSALVDQFVPDPVSESNYLSQWRMEALRWNIASLIVAAPIYLLLTRMHLLSYARDPERRTSGVRKWLTYLTLFVATLILIGTLISLLANALGGELAARFLLKALIALFISVGVLAYYRWELRQPGRVEQS